LPGDPLDRYRNGEREKRIAPETFGAPRQDRQGFRSSVLRENVERGGADVSLRFELEKIAQEPGRLRAGQIPGEIAGKQTYVRIRILEQGRQVRRG